MATNAPSTVDAAELRRCGDRGASSADQRLGFAAADEFDRLRWFHMTLILSLANSRSWRIFSARERIAAMDQGHVVAVVGQVQRFLDRGVAAADHRDLLAAVEEPVAGRAGRRALAASYALPTAAPSHLACAPVAMTRASPSRSSPLSPVSRNGAARQVDRDDMVPHHLGADMLGLGLHLLHQPRALDDVAEAGIVLDVGGGGQLAAGLDALDQDRRQPGARGVDRGGVAGGPRAEDRRRGWK